MQLSGAAIEIQGRTSGNSPSPWPWICWAGPMIIASVQCIQIPQVLSISKYQALFLQVSCIPYSSAGMQVFLPGLPANK